MPTRTTHVPPELVLEHKGVRVFRAYIDDDADQPEKYIFATDTETYDVRLLSTTLNAQQPAPINAPMGTDLKLFMQTETYFQARLAWDNWFDVTEPALIRQALIDGIDRGHIK